MSNKDIVYFVKDTKENEELRYSLRSVEKNFPHARVWFVGGCPNGIVPDVHIPVAQTQRNKYLRVRNMIELIIRKQDLSDNFWLFNDDFFVMSKVSYVLPAIDGSLARKVQALESSFKRKTAYSNKLRNTIFALRDKHKDRLNYELHIPMEINKDKAHQVLLEFNDNVAFRSAYGNYFDVAKTIHPDVKVYDTEERYNPDIHNVFLSTSDVSFERGVIGRFIRSSFVEPSRFEADIEL